MASSSAANPPTAQEILNSADDKIWESASDALNIDTKIENIRNHNKDRLPLVSKHMAEKVYTAYEAAERSLNAFRTIVVVLESRVSDFRANMEDKQMKVDIELERHNVVDAKKKAENAVEKYKEASKILHPKEESTSGNGDK